MNSLKEEFIRHKRKIFLILLLIVISPIFGIYLADMVGYHEPLDIVAEKLGLSERPPLYQSPFSDYSIPGLPVWLGYIISGIIGAIVIIFIGFLSRLIISRGRK